MTLGIFLVPSFSFLAIHLACLAAFFRTLLLPADFPGRSLRADVFGDRRTAIFTQNKPHSNS
jgi:hypothetical protein